MSKIAALSAFSLATAMALLIAVAWSWIGVHWGFHRLPALVDVTGLPPAHARVFCATYKILWHAGGLGFAAVLLLGAAVAFLDWDPPPIIVAVCAAGFAIGPMPVALLGVPWLDRNVPRRPSTAVLSWVLLLAVLYAAWHFANVR